MCKVIISAFTAIYCHYGAGTYQTTAFYNYPYSVTFGGNPDTAPATIFDAFNDSTAGSSYHNLNDVLNFAKGQWSSTFTADSNPCSACHNVHLAKRNKEHKGDPAYTAMSKPSAHDALWGDTSGETLRDYTTLYQAPYSDTGTPKKYEPDDTTTEPAGGWGSNMPDYPSFCLDCHSNAVTSTTLGRSLLAIDWSATGDIHGGRARTSTCNWENHGDGQGTWTGLDPPYDEGVSNYVLSCTDCHEPHGARRNTSLLRKYINGEEVEDSDLAAGYWNPVCSRCHNKDYSSMGACNDASCCHGPHAHGATTCMCSFEPSF